MLSGTYILVWKEKTYVGISKCIANRIRQHYNLEGCRTTKSYFKSYGKPLYLKYKFMDYNKAKLIEKKLKGFRREKKIKYFNGALRYTQSSEERSDEP